MKPTDATAPSQGRREAMLALLLEEQRRVVRSRRQRRRVTLGAIALIVIAGLAVALRFTTMPTATPTTTSEEPTIARVQPGPPSSDTGPALTDAPRESRWTIRREVDPSVVERLSVIARREVPIADDDDLLDHLAAAGRRDSLVRVGGEVFLVTRDSASPNGG